MTKFEEEFNYLIELSGKVLIGQVDAETFEKNRIAFFEKYETDQQQALPVVPECVGIWIKKCQELNWMITDVLAPESWSSDFAKDTENWLKKSKENFNLLALAFITGKYEVEKPQLFYLKNKLTLLNLVLEKCFNSSGDHVGERFREYNMQCIVTDEQEARLYKNTFTQKEIDDLDTGGYEQIEVAE